MRMYDIIEKKKNGGFLSKEEIRFVVDGFTNGSIPDYQMSALLMAICLREMTSEETYELTMAMKESGESLDLSSIDGVKVDKHSTGGVGDKTTLIIGPIVAALGIPVAKMSGRGLGHTGGTIDKLESIKGFNTTVALNDFMNQINDIKIAVAGQTAKLAPADKKIYALRDVTATVDNISLIASSIMSKKLASGADAIVLDVKCGSGAFMKEEAEALKLASAMVNIGRSAGKSMTAVVTDMNEPLGRYVGNSMEVYEAVMCLKGDGDSKLMEVCKVLSGYMILAAGVAKSYEEAILMVDEVIENGKALNKLIQLVESQGGDSDYIKNTQKLPTGKIVCKLTAEKSGIVTELNAQRVGKACMALGGGRETKESVIDLGVGIYLDKKTGEEVYQNEVLCTIYGNEQHRVQNAMDILAKAYTINNDIKNRDVANKSMVLKVIC